MSELSILSDARELISYVYRIVNNKFPHEEKYALTSQITRASVSIALNIREGNVFTGDKKKNFFRIAHGSLCEVDECMIIAHKLNYITNIDLDEFRKNYYWRCLNKLKSLIKSVHSGEKQ